MLKGWTTTNHADKICPLCDSDYQNFFFFTEMAVLKYQVVEVVTRINFHKHK